MPLDVSSSGIADRKAGSERSIFERDLRFGRFRAYAPRIPPFLVCVPKQHYIRVTRYPGTKRRFTITVGADRRCSTASDPDDLLRSTTALLFNSMRKSDSSPAPRQRSALQGQAPQVLEQSVSQSRQQQSHLIRPSAAAGHPVCEQV